MNFAIIENNPSGICSELPRSKIIDTIEALINYGEPEKVNGVEILVENETPKLKQTLITNFVKCNSGLRRHISGLFTLIYVDYIKKSSNCRSSWQDVVALCETHFDQAWNAPPIKGYKWFGINGSRNLYKRMDGSWKGASGNDWSYWWQGHCG
ncbi:unnamed protein product [Blepharisma stoltei]|uniref:Uncharacterized protein n=1 Tax=Blepharisma stoltei TaxID=1481888 RepID=A0AAU9JR88_9CILI|nr:unnamed protein product [Blepharisma stoltei]